MKPSEEIKANYERRRNEHPEGRFHWQALETILDWLDANWPAVEAIDARSERLRERLDALVEDGRGEE